MFDIGGDFSADAEGSLGASVAAAASASIGAAVSASLSAAASASAGASISAAAGARLAAPAKLKPGDRLVVDPSPLFRFKVQIQGVSTAVIQTCGPIHISGRAGTQPQSPGAGQRQSRGAGQHQRQAATQGAIDAPSGGKTQGATMLPARTWTWDPLVLQRGIASDGVDLWNWVMKAVTGQIDPRTVTVTLLDQAGNEQITWAFQKAYPTDWATVAAFTTNENTKVAIEKITLNHQGVIVTYKGQTAGVGATTGTPPPSPAGAASAGAPGASGGTTSADAGASTVSPHQLGATPSAGPR